MVRVVFLLSIAIENDIIDGENTTINHDKQKRSSSRKPSFCVRSLKNKWFVLLSILFILILVILIVVLIESNHINNFRINQSFISKIGHQSNKRLLEQQETIERLNKTFIERKPGRSEPCYNVL
jgi:hypothetical protein